MEIPGYQPFYLHSVDELRAEIVRLGLAIPLDDRFARLGEPLSVGGRVIPNRFCAQPISSGDADADGAPGPLTRRRYRRYAEGRFGLIWMESTAAGDAGKPGQLRLHEGSFAAFRSLVEELKACAPDRPAIVIQIGAATEDRIAHAARLAAEAGFDGVDLHCSREALPAALAAVRKRAPELLLTTRLCAYEAVRQGFGVSTVDYRMRDPAEPIRFVKRLRECGLALLNVTAASPRLRGPERALRAHRDSEDPDEHPLMALDRQLGLARALREAVQGMPVVGSGFSWLRQFVPEVAAGALRDEMIDFAGLGRAALAHPAAPAEIFSQGRMNAGSACIVCHACSQLQAQGETVGCVLRDPETYGSVYRQMRRFDADLLLAGASRCHLCEAAPCVAASPTRTDIPAFIRAFRAGDERGAYEILRQSDPLPELTARFAPGWMESEGACIESTLTGVPVPILDLQWAVAWRARGNGQTGVCVPDRSTGRTVAVVGGGTAGISATVRLVELGHAVDLYERLESLGGVPERVLSSHRQFSPRAEIEALLQPAIATGRLRIHFGRILGKNLTLQALKPDHDAILLATGLWRERSLGSVPGVFGALSFLESFDHNVPDRAAVLAGGDAAMDAALVLQKRGAKELFVVFAGPRSAMHWHLAESWFSGPGVHSMMNWQPLGYQTDSEGRLSGIQLRHLEFHVETVLPVRLVVEAMALEAEDSVLSALANEAGRIHVAGALANGGGSVGHCVAEGLAAAAAIHQDLFP